MFDIPAMGHTREKRALWLLLLAVAVISIISMPREEYGGDSMTLRCTTVSLINYQDLDVPAPLAQRLESKTAHYYFENPSNHKFYCIYGILNPILYLPSLLVEKWREGRLDYLSDHRSIYLNWLNIVLTIASAWYLFRVALKYTFSPALALIYVLTEFYCTFWWYYLRAQSYEIYQTLFILAYYYHFTSSFCPLTEAIEAGTPSGRWWNPFLAGAWLGALILVKTVYILLIPFSCVVIVLSWLSCRCSYTDILRRAVLFGIAIAGALFILLAANWYQYGSPFESGWSQVVPIFSGHISEGVYGFLFEHDHSIFVYFPIFTLALFGYPKFFKCHRLDPLLFSSITILMLLVCSKFWDWSGGWGYGSRHLLPYLPLASLPFIKTMELLLKHRRQWWALGCSAAVAAVLVLSFNRQLDVNALPFFGYYKLKNFFLGFHVPSVDEYFKAHSFFEVDADLVVYKHGKPWPVLTEIEPVLNANGVKTVKDLVHLYTVSNYYLWPDTSQQK